MPTTTPLLLLPQLLLLLLLQAPSARCELPGPEAAARLLPTATIGLIHHELASGKFTCEQLIREQLRRVDAYNPKLHAFTALRRSAAIAEAKEVDAKGSKAGRLKCVPVAVKDNIDVAGMPTTNGAAAFVNSTASVDSGIVAKIRAEGGIVIGKANMAEMSDSGTDSNSTVGGLCGNPWNPKRSCLGSSGGSSAAVAAGLSVIGIGTDTEGSVIGPCTAAGLLCMRPSQTAQFESVMTGVYPAFQKQDMVGLMARNSEDFLLVFDVVYGTNYTSTIAKVNRLAGVSIHVLQNFYEPFSLGPSINYKPNAEIVAAHKKALNAMAQFGAKVTPYKLTLMQLAGKLQQIMHSTITKAPCSKSCMVRDVDRYFKTNHGAFNSTKDLLAVKQQLPAMYQKKLNTTLSQNKSDICNANTSCKGYMQARRTITAILTEMIGNATVLAMPFIPILPQLNGAHLALADELSPALNPYSGWPSITIPVGFSSPAEGQPRGMPIGLVLVARTNQEATLAQLANAYLNKFHKVTAPKSTPELEPLVAKRIGGASVVFSGNSTADAAAAAAAAAADAAVPRKSSDVS